LYGYRVGDEAAEAAAEALELLARVVGHGGLRGVAQLSKKRGGT
jgi:hypothetical protein